MPNRNENSLNAPNPNNNSIYINTVAFIQRIPADSERVPRIFRAHPGHARSENKQRKKRVSAKRPESNR